MKTIKYIISLIAIIVISTSCVQEKHLKTMTFKVNMRGIDNVTNVGVRGQFTTPSWKTTYYLKDDDNDSIYEGTITREAAQSGFAFKFVNQDSVYELQDQKNRFLKLQYKPEHIVYEATFNNPDHKQTSL
ncbi:hypothetical protein [Olleya sp. YS]|uniref:hypothetical protein n=1 Tax=Olleya sp. YS TaxID=3028318 RepID=UPI0024342763|nr:hypothetical protein [Olleya sp. YS]WGD34224.1 hypothetical protein Ollyesu_10595 [Olleya sp. YS]